MHDKTSSLENANFKMYPSPQKTELPPEKKLPPPPLPGHHLKNLEHPADKKLKSLGIS